MGSFIHYCEYCNVKLSVDDVWLGKSMQCPACNKKITFPEVADVFDQYPSTIELQSDSLSEDSDMPSAPDFQMPEPPVAPDDISEDLTGENDSEYEEIESFSDTPESENSDFSNANSVEEAPGNASDTVAPTAGAAFIPFKKGFFNGSYFWGRVGSASVYVLAALILLSGVYYSLHFYWDYTASEDKIEEKQTLTNVNKELNSREKSLSEQFKNAINLLQGSGTISRDGVLDGLVLTDDICRRPDPMPLGIQTDSELKVAQTVLEQYKTSNAKLKEKFVKCFGNILSWEKQSTGSTSARHVSQIILKAGEIKQQFYTNESVKLQLLDSLERAVENVKQSVESRGNAVQKREVKRFEAASVFVRKQLFPAENNITVVKSLGRTVLSGGDKSPGELAAAAKIIESLADGWRLDEEIAGMEKLLEKVPVMTKQYEKKKNDLLRKMAKEMVTLWLKTLLAAFALLVAGDVLRAFFDKADILRSIEGKK